MAAVARSAGHQAAAHRADTGAPRRAGRGGEAARAEAAAGQGGEAGPGRHRRLDPATPRRQPRPQGGRGGAAEPRPRGGAGHQDPGQPGQHRAAPRRQGRPGRGGHQPPGGRGQLAAAGRAGLELPAAGRGARRGGLRDGAAAPRGAGGRQPLHGALQLAPAAPGRGHGAAGPRVAADQQGRGQQRAPPRPHGAGGGAGAGGRGEDCLRNSGGRVEARGGEAESVYNICISIYTTAQVRLPTPPPTPGSVARAATLDRWRWRLEHLELDSGDSEGEEAAETAEEVKQLHHSDHDQVDNEINEQNKPSWKKCDFKNTSDLKSKGREIGAEVMTPSSVDVGNANVANYSEMRSALLQQLDQIKLKHKEKVSNEIEEKKKSYNQALER